MRCGEFVGGEEGFVVLREVGVAVEEFGELGFEE